MPVRSSTEILAWNVVHSANVPPPTTIWLPMQSFTKTTAPLAGIGEPHDWLIPASIQTQCATFANAELESLTPRVQRDGARNRGRMSKGFLAAKVARTRMTDDRTQQNL